MLTEFVPGRVWTQSAPLRFYGIPVGARMTVIRMGDGRLLLHSPIASSDALRAAVDRLGRVDWIFAPNRFHHLYANEWAVAYPDAQVAGPRGLHQKRRDLPISMFADEDAPDAIDPEIRLIGIGGWPVLDEVVLVDTVSGTLVTADLVQCAVASDPLILRLLGHLDGFYGTPRMPRSLRWMIRDRAAFRASLHRLLACDFGRLIMAHGPPLEFGAREHLRRVFDWALE